MFTELMPVIKDRPVTITVTSIDKTQIRVNVIPKAIDTDSQLVRDVTQKDGVTKEATVALITPLTLTGTPEEIDAELPQLLASYAEGHTTVLESFTELKDALTAAAKAAKDATAKAKTKTSAKPDEKGKTTPHPAKPATAGAAKAPDSFTLWEASSEANAAVHADEPASAPPANDDEMPTELPDEEFNEGEAE